MAYSTPLCDADPAALSKYVSTLAIKEKPDSETDLRGAIAIQLDDFLQPDTNGIVDKLLVTLETKSHLQSNPPAAPQAEAPPFAAAAAVIPTAEEVKTERNSQTSSTKSKAVGRTKRRSWNPRSRSSEWTGRQQRSLSMDRSSRDHRGGRGGEWDADRRNPVGSRRRTDRNRPRSPLPSGRRLRSPRNSSSRQPRSPSGSTNIKQPDVVSPSDNAAATSTPEVTSGTGMSGNKFR